MPDVMTTPALTFQEKRIVAQIIAGKKQSEIATAVFLSYRRVKEVISAMKLKYDCQTLEQLVHFLTINNLYDGSAGR